MRRSDGRLCPGLRGTGERPLLSRRLTGLRSLLRLRDFARLPALLAPLLTLLLLTLRLRFLRLTGEGLADSEELAALILGLVSLSESLESEAAGLAFVLGTLLGLASLSESLTGSGLLLLLLTGLLSSLSAGDLTFTGVAFFSLGPASSDSESDAGLSDLTLTSGSGSVFLAALLLLSFSEGLALPLSLLCLLSFLAFLSSGGFLRSLLAALDLSERRSLLRLRGGEGEGVRRRLAGLRLLSLLNRSRCRSDIGLLPRLRGDERLGLDLDRLGGVLLLGEERRLGLLEERLRLLVLRLRGLSGLLALFLPLDRDLDLELALLLEDAADLLRLLLLALPLSLVVSASGLPSGLGGSSLGSGKADGLAVTCKECCCLPFASSSFACAVASFLAASSLSSIATAAAVSALSTSSVRCTTRPCSSCRVCAMLADSACLACARWAKYCAK